MFSFLKRWFGMEEKPVESIDLNRKLYPDAFANVNPKDPRFFLADDEEWVTPTEWFTDKDGKQCRKKRKKNTCCGCNCGSDDEGGEFPDVSDAVNAVVELGQVFGSPEELDDDAQTDNDVPDTQVDTTPTVAETYSPPPPPPPAYEAPPSYSPPPPPPPSYDYTPSSDYGSSYDSGSSSSYDSGSSSSSDCGSCGGGD
jgi:hypothetical protein